MKILFGMPDKNSWGGVQAAEPPFVAALRNLGVEAREETYVYGEKAHKITFSERVNRVSKTALKFRQITRRERFDVLHLNTAFDRKTILRDLATISLLKREKIKIFLKLHGSENELLENPSRATQMLWRRLLQSVDGIGVLSSEERANFIKAGIAPEKVFTVKNAVRAPENLAPRSFAEKPFRLLFVSRFVRSKGLFETCSAVARLLDQGFDICLDCLGDGAERQRVEQTFASTANKIRFHGYVAEETVNKFYQQSDALIFPTRHAEGFPMVVFNAMAHGLPIVTTKIRAMADYLTEPKNCLWTTTDENADKNLEDLSQKIILLFEKRDLCGQISDNNRALAREFAPEKVAREFLSVYQKLLETK